MRSSNNRKKCINYNSKQSFKQNIMKQNSYNFLSVKNEFGNRSIAIKIKTNNGSSWNRIFDLRFIKYINDNRK